MNVIIARQKRITRKDYIWQTLTILQKKLYRLYFYTTDQYCLIV